MKLNSILKLFGLYYPTKYVHTPVEFTSIYDACCEAITIAKQRRENITLRFRRFDINVSPTSTPRELCDLEAQLDGRSPRERIEESRDRVMQYKIDNDLI